MEERENTREFDLYYHDAPGKLDFVYKYIYTMWSRISPKGHIKVTIEFYPEGENEQAS